MNFLNIHNANSVVVACHGTAFFIPCNKYYMNDGNDLKAAGLYLNR